MSLRRISFRNSFTLVALLIGAATLGTPTVARADFEIRYSLDGGVNFTTLGMTSNNPGTVGGLIDGINITGTASDNLATGKSTLDLSVSGALSTTLINGLIVEASVTGVFTAPKPQSFSWSFTSSSDTGVTESGQGWLDQSNQLYAGATGGPGGTNILATTGLLTAPAKGSTTFSGDVPYSWTEQYTLSGLVLAGTGISTDNRETISVPAPAGLVLAITGMPVLGLGAWFRRRRTGAVA
jgi:hypothetical protein